MMDIERFNKFAELIAHSAVVIGLILAVVGYMSERSARREQFTVEYSRVYNGEHLQSSRTRIRALVRSMEVALSGYRISNTSIADLLVKQIKAGGEKTPESDILAVAEYFNGALSCVEAELCDDELFKKMHSNEASSLACFISPALDEISLRGGQSEMKRGLLHFRSASVIC
ncbi:hypothetical protein [Aminobacter sp. HY435]|uniref:hypothetical protein n=1 Tax=Aminobacter sp. HY435 TaxID=2970917 RepID=UPI0022B96925|nr:hypothetical protein [Aminobacter sp. HY435]